MIRGRPLHLSQLRVTEVKILPLDHKFLLPQNFPKNNYPKKIKTLKGNLTLPKALQIPKPQKTKKQLTANNLLNFQLLPVEETLGECCI